MTWGAFANSAVWRMRLALFIICLLTVIALAVGAVGLFNIRDAQVALRSEAVPALERVEALNDRLLSLQQVIATLRTIESPETFRLAITDAEAHSNQLAAMVADQSGLAMLVGQLRTRLRTIAELANAHFSNLAEIVVVRANAIAADSALTQIIEASVVDAATKLEASLFDEAAAVKSEELILGITEINALSQLGFTSEKIRDAIGTLSLARSDVEAGALKERLAFNLRSSVTELTQLSRGPTRSQLAAALSRLREQLLSETGLVSLELTRIEWEAEFGEHLRQLEKLINQASAQMSAGVSQARSGIRDSVAAVDRVVDDTIFQLGVFSAVILSLTAVTAIVLVEGQIIRRMNSLSGSVREIAAGNTATPVHVQGSDEFGDMARALEAFKSNTKELHRSNAELSRFAYAASHDLRSPLRAIRDLAQWTLEDADDGLPDHCRENLVLLISRVDRLAKLLGNLLDYSRVGREDSSIAKIDLAELPFELVELLGVEDRFVVDVRGDLMPVETFDAPLRQIMLNLISNAIKHHDRGSGRLTMEVHRYADRLKISLTDDGPGIPPEYHERIFGLFEMLKTRDEVEGSGMGLAIIRKQVECYGGEVTVVSDPDNQRGTTFVFDWPIHVKQAGHLAAA